MLFRLSHMNVHAESGMPYEVDIKLIGYYSAFERAVEARDRYSAIQGFSNFRQGFRIEALENETSGGPDDPKAGFVIGYSDLSEAGESLEFFIGGYYPAMKSAQHALDEIRRMEPFQSAGERLGIAAFTVDQGESWREGFVTV